MQRYRAPRTYFRCSWPIVDAPSDSTARQNVPPPHHSHEARLRTRDVAGEGGLDRSPRHRRPQRRLNGSMDVLGRIGSSRSASTRTTAFSTQPGRRGRCRQATTCRRGLLLARTAASSLLRRPNDPCRSWFDRTPIRSIKLMKVETPVAMKLSRMGTKEPIAETFSPPWGSRRSLTSPTTSSLWHVHRHLAREPPAGVCEEPLGWRG